MIARAVTWASTIATLAVLISFGLFAIDQARDGSKQQVAAIHSELGSTREAKAAANVNQADPSLRTERIRERRHGDLREAIDDVNDVLVSPFANVVSSNDIWAQRGIPSLIALLVFGLGLRILAGYLPGGMRR